MGMIFGGIIAGIVGIITAGVAHIFAVKRQEKAEKKTKEDINLSILLEIKANQELLGSFIVKTKEVISKVDKEKKSRAVFIDFDLVDPGLDKTIYSALSYKLNLIDSSIRDNVIQYYQKIRLVESEMRACNKIYPSYYGEKVIAQLKEFALKRCKDNAEEAYELGTVICGSFN